MTWIEDTIVAKSDQLNADDLVSGPIVVTVQAVKQMDSRDQPCAIEIDGDRQPYKPCLSMRRLLVHCWGKHTEEWVGRQMRLYNDPSVRYGGKETGGIRIDALSHIEKVTKCKMQASRGKRVEYTVEPLATTAVSSTSDPPQRKDEPTIAERCDKAVKAYEDAQTDARITKLDSHLEHLFQDLDDEQKQRVEAARNAAIERAAVELQ